MDGNHIVHHWFVLVKSHVAIFDLQGICRSSASSKKHCHPKSTVEELPRNRNDARNRSGRAYNLAERGIRQTTDVTRSSAMQLRKEAVMK
jgi:hypothetical protein